MSQMRAEIDEAPEVVARVLANLPAIAAVASRIRTLAPPFVTLAARGSSSHAGTFLRVLIGRDLGLTAAAALPSLASVYRTPQRLTGALFIAISQSGRSPDLIACAEQARAGGALTLAIVNDPASPLADACELVLDIQAGPERSVAATKTVIATLATCLALVRLWRGTDVALDTLPARLAAAPDWPGIAATLATTAHIFTIGRGPALGIAKELALKLAETCGIAGLAFSAAELAHGPMALAGKGFPVLALLQDDAALPHSEALLTSIAARETEIFAAGGNVTGGTALPVLPPTDADADLIVMLVSAYRAIEAAARARGLDPDHPRALQKVTRTV
jgi:glucosamine--fructose-6-phosphate aminotransferase (isomerizing)